MDNRAPRDMDTRENSEEHEETWVPTETIPMPTPVPGWAYRYMRVSSLGETDTLNMGAYRREGWEIVKPEEQPEVAFAAACDGADRIEVGGLVLVKTPEAKARARDRYYRELSNRQLEAVDNQLMAENDSRMPIFRERKSKTTRSLRD